MYRLMLIGFLSCLLASTSLGVDIPFIANKGQYVDEVSYYARTFGGGVFVTRRGEIVHSLSAGNGKGWALREQPVNGSLTEPFGMDRSEARVNYFLGSGWIHNAGTCTKVRLGEPYPGIVLDLVARDDNVEKLFTLQPGADPGRIRMQIDGALQMEVNDAGELVVSTGHGPAVFTRPLAWQEENSARRYVEASYIVEGNEYGFVLGAFDSCKPLYIDPLLASTFLGGTKNEGTFIADCLHIDGAGHLYVAGPTNAVDFPVTAGAFCETHNGGYDVFVAKLDADLKTLVAATFLGGSNDDGGWRGVSLCLDKEGKVIVAGQTASADFPVTAGAFDTTHNGGDDLFVSKLSGDLSTLEASTLLGGEGWDVPFSITTDSDGGVYIGGHTQSTGYPTTAGAFDSTYAGTSLNWAGDIFLSRLDGSLSTLVASTYLGGKMLDFGGFITLDGNGNVYVCGCTACTDFPTTPGAYCESHNPVAGGYGCDMFITRFDPLFTTVLNSTFLGGTLDDWAYSSVAIDANNDIYVTGHVSSSDFPTTSGAFDTTYNGVPGVDVGDDMPVSKLSGDLSTLLASTFIGSKYFDLGLSLKFASNGDVVVAGYAGSEEFPSTPGAYDETFNGQRDAVVSRFSADLTTLHASTFLGHGGWDRAFSCAIAPDGSIYATGLTSSSNFPVTPGAFDTTYGGGGTYGGDLFICKLDKDLSANPALMTDAQKIPASTGGTVNLTLTAGESQAKRNYLVLGSLSGTTPGYLLPGGFATLPLNWDAFTDLMLLFINTPVFADFLGTLDGKGGAFAQINAPPLPGFGGTIMYYAYALNNPFDFASNAVEIEIAP